MTLEIDEISPEMLERITIMMQGFFPELRIPPEILDEPSNSTYVSFGAPHTAMLRNHYEQFITTIRERRNAYNTRMNQLAIDLVSNPIVSNNFLYIQSQINRGQWSDWVNEVLNRSTYQGDQYQHLRELSLYDLTRVWDRRHFRPLRSDSAEQQRSIYLGAITAIFLFFIMQTLKGSYLYLMMTDVDMLEATSYPLTLLVVSAILYLYRNQSLFTRCVVIQ